jgi:hypothetical protein
VSTFHARLIPLLAQDLVAAGVVATAEQVYTGRRPQKVTRSLEVWLERLPVVWAGTGTEDLFRHGYRLHLRALSNAGGDKTGKSQVEALEALLRTLVRRYQGARPFAGSLRDLVAVDAQEDVVDRDPEDEQVQDATLRLEFLVRG